jgi:cytosine/uracil/thiamine/allantoin permease
MSAGGLVGLFVNFIVFSVISSVIGYAIDILIGVMNTTPGLSMDVVNTVGNLHLIYIAGPFLYTLALGYNYIVVSNSESNAEV